jgi:hypothetical protein
VRGETDIAERLLTVGQASHGHLFTDRRNVLLQGYLYLKCSFVALVALVANIADVALVSLVTELLPQSVIGPQVHHIPTLNKELQICDIHDEKDVL